MQDNPNPHPLSEDISLISEAIKSQDYEPIQKDAKLFKFILNTTKIEIKFNSLIRLIYNTSLFDISLWVLGFLLFIASPKDMYLIWFLAVHIGKAITGLYLLDKIPKTYEILENIAKNPNVDENKIIDLLKKELKDSFLKKWDENKKKFLAYLIGTCICLLIDFIIFIVQVAAFGKEEWLLMQTCMLFTILVFIVNDVVYFLWFFTLEFTFAPEILQPIKKAIFGSVGELMQLARTEMKNINWRGGNNDANNQV